MPYVCESVNTAVSLASHVSGKGAVAQTSEMRKLDHDARNANTSSQPDILPHGQFTMSLE